jgi:cation diffusion facilitator CzcD-associated flavoprotein CzcO
MCIPSFLTLPGARVVYDSLVTNLPKQIMCFKDFAFDAALPSFVTTADVGRYLNRFCDTFGLSEHIRLQTNVSAVRRLGSGKWTVQTEPAATSTMTAMAATGVVSTATATAAAALTNETSTSAAATAAASAAAVPETKAETHTYTFDAVVVANGHYDTEVYAPLVGSDVWPGVTMHSADYNKPTPLKEKVVLCIGARASGTGE